LPLSTVAGVLHHHNSFPPLLSMHHLTGATTRPMRGRIITLLLVVSLDTVYLDQLGTSARCHYHQRDQEAGAPIPTEIDITVFLYHPCW
jgi:hypothetical protein